MKKSSRSIDTVSQKIDLTAYGLHRDHPPARKLKCLLIPQHFRLLRIGPNFQVVTNILFTGFKNSIKLHVFGSFLTCKMFLYLKFFQKFEIISTLQIYFSGTTVFCLCQNFDRSQIIFQTLFIPKRKFSRSIPYLI